MGEARPGTDGLFRSSWAPVLIASRGTPDAVDRAAVRNVVETDDDVVYANQPAKPAHLYEKPREVLGHILARVCRRGDVVLDPFAGSGSSPVATEKLGLDLVWKGRGYYHFRGFGRCATGPDGSFRIVTLKPGPLPTPDGGLEAPPLDVSVFARGLLDRW